MRVTDVPGGGAAQLACGGIGGAIAVLFTAPRVAAIPAAPHAVTRTSSDLGARC